jgi:pimeloyl-ACP methyl ester carboxylesterase
VTFTSIHRRPRQEPPLFFRLFRLCVALAALAAIADGLFHLHAATDGLLITHTSLGTTPVTVFRPTETTHAPVVVIAHGFAGSQQLMLPFAVTLARNGYIAVTFDFPGHGRNPQPLLGGLSDDETRSRLLLNSLGDVVDYARALPDSNGQVALLGHSMASDIVVRYAETHPDIRATVAVSLFSRGITATSPRNLLVIVGALEPAVLRDEALRVVGLTAGGPPEPRITYGNFAAGTARRLSFSGGVEHIGVLFSRQSMVEALAWMNGTFNRTSDGYLDDRAPWLGVLFLGLVALAWPLSRLLPLVTSVRRGGALNWGRLLPVAIAPALLTPLLLWKLPTNFLPILLGDYLTVHFALYGVLTAGCLFLVRRRRVHRGPRSQTSLWRLLLAVVAVAAYSIFALGTPLDSFITSYLPTRPRLPLIAAVLAGTLPYFVADEWATRGATAPLAGYLVTKICFLLSLMLAVALNPQRLFFLIIIVPVMVIFLAVYGLFSGWTYRRTHHPLVAALANAVAFAWSIAVTFPVIG